MPLGVVVGRYRLGPDLPDLRSQQEVLNAVNVVHEARSGTAPFFQFLEPYQASEHHLGSGRHDQSVIAACDPRVRPALAGSPHPRSWQDDCLQLGFGRSFRVGALAEAVFRLGSVRDVLRSGHDPTGCSSIRTSWGGGV